MVNVVVDLNHLFHRWGHFLGYRNDNFLDNEEHKPELIQNVMFSLFTDISKYDRHLKRVILAVDSASSWRKDVDMGDEEYKGKRKTEFKFNKVVFFQLLKEFTQIMSEKNIIVLEYDRAEGDDLIAMSAGLLYSKDESVIIITSDSDIKQLVRSEGEKFIYVWDSDKDKKYHCIDRELNISDGNELDVETINVGGDIENDDFGGIFETSVEDLGVKTNSIKSLLNDIYHNAHHLNPYEIVFKKMLSGDKGDNVPSCYYYRKLKKNGEPYKNAVSFTEPRAIEVYKKFRKVVTNMDSLSFYRTIYKSESWRKKIAEFVMKEVEMPVDEATIEEIADNIRRNLTMTFLNSTVYEEEFKKGMIAYINDELFNSEKMELHEQAIKNGFQYELLKDTPYDMGDNNAKSWDDKSIRY